MTGRNAFNEVRGLLDRMERSIDEARDRRLGKDDPEPITYRRANEPGSLDTVIGSSDAMAASDDATGGVPRPDASAASRSPEPESSVQPGEAQDVEDTENRSKYGRAKPLRRPPSPSGDWKS
ncbi:MAG: hypothetical protein AAF235_12310 [Planctomycetota bacterium]